MIRFCDSDVGCVEYGLLSRSGLLSYFLSGHLDEMVCVYDSSYVESFVGIITYNSLLHSISIDAAICRDYIILDDDIWRKARDIFRKKGREIRNAVPLPVLNKDYQLICFAYQDEDANREIRMLRELQTVQGAIQFLDAFPEYKCVKIHGFNELAYFFVEYLRNQGLQVQVYGEMWQAFTAQDYVSETCQIPEYECLNIYAEGTWEKPRNWKENLLRSVSVEFECIDKIYEINIKNNVIRDAETGCRALLERLRDGEQIILCGCGAEVQDAYDFLIKNEIEISCFMDNEVPAGNMHRLFGKEIVSFEEAVRSDRNPVFINCTAQHSAWGAGETDYFDYIGYKRNDRYILLRDYIEAPRSNLLNTLSKGSVVLTGDQYFCGKLYEYFVQKEISVIGYLYILQEDMQPENMVEALPEIVSKDVMCCIVEPVYQNGARTKYIGKAEKEQRKAFLREKNIDNYTEYFCDTFPFVDIEKENNFKYKNEWFKPKRIVLGSILHCSGNLLVRSLLDSHPLILEMQYGELNQILFWICVRLSVEKAENILPIFWKMIEGDESCIADRSAFVEKMEQLLACASRFTSQELFVMFHIAYACMFRKDITEDNIRNMIIYWEPHYVERDRLEDMVKWLGDEEVPCDILNVVRNSIAQRGGHFKEIKRRRGAYFRLFLRSLPVKQKKYEWSNRLVMKFEDLKCNPKESLEEMCERWDIAWSDTLMQTTQNGKEYVYYNNVENISGFDLKPVYNTYENFFSELDRMRLMIIDAPERKKYGYPYVDPKQFTRRELQEMLLKEFRFETTGYYEDYLNLEDRIILQENLRRRVQEVRCLLSLWDSIV